MLNKSLHIAYLAITISITNAKNKYNEKNINGRDQSFETSITEKYFVTTFGNNVHLPEYFKYLSCTIYRFVNKISKIHFLFHNTNIKDLYISHEQIWHPQNP